MPTCSETNKKIIKSPNVVLFKDKMYLENCPRGRLDEAFVVKVDIFPKLDVEHSDVSGNVSEQDMEEDAKANVPAAKIDS